MTQVIHTDPHATTDRETTTLGKTSVITPGLREPAAPPLAVVLCAHCWAADDRPDPPGWVVAGARSPYQFGVCPACVVVEYQFSAADCPSRRILPEHRSPPMTRPPHTP